MPSETRALKRARREAAENWKAASPLAKLPLEVMGLVFEYAVDSGSPVAALRMAHVNRRWRELALNTPSLWGDAQLPRSLFRSRDDEALAGLLRLCAKHSRHQMTHITLCGFRDLDIFQKCIKDVVGYSHPTLIDIEISDNTLCHAGEGFNKEHNMAAREKMRDFAGVVQDLVDQSSHLDRLCLNYYFLGLQRVPPDCEARPRQLTLMAPMACCDSGYNLQEDRVDMGEMEEVPNELSGDLAFWQELASGVEHFVYDDPWPMGPEWPQWAFSTVYLRSQHLRSCHLSTNIGLGMKAISQAACYPLLEELRLSDIGRTTFRADRESWLEALQKPVCFEAPALKRLYASPSMAEKIKAPALETAYMILNDPSDLDKLPALLVAWPQLECLTLENYPDRDFNLAWKTEVVQTFVDTLSPAKHGSVCNPKLRHLGILSDGPNKKLTEDYFEKKPFDWAATPWSPKDLESYYGWAFSNYEYDRCPRLGAELAELELQRRQLSQGHEVTSGAPADTAAPTGDAARLSQQADLQVTCHPEPSKAEEMYAPKVEDKPKAKGKGKGKGKAKAK